jgi:predicted glycogen debranching enzyme
MLGRDVCGHWHAAIAHEWLVTNGLGGYACGTVAGANTRRYHGFLMASLEPPVGRTLLVAKVDLDVEYLGHAYALSANEFVGTTVDPRGFVHLESFAVEAGVPVWRFAIADALLEQKIFMARGANQSYLRLEVLRASAPLTVRLKPLVTYRDYHSHSRGRRPFRALPDPAAAADAEAVALAAGALAAGTLAAGTVAAGTVAAGTVAAGTVAGGAGAAGCTIDPGDGGKRYRLHLSRGTYTPADVWYWNFLHREEFARGLDAREDLWGPGLFTSALDVGEPVFFSASLDAPDAHAAPDDVLASVIGQAAQRVAALPPSAPGWVQTLAIAADQFLVQRGPRDSSTASVIAGYPWFSDWGRDTMISLPGLTTALGRHDAAAAILRTYAKYVDGGLLPNRFADAGGGLEYNTADATLWMFRALDEHLKATHDPTLLAELFPTLIAIIHAHVDGTRYGIKVDAADGLLHAGEPGSQLTWMDAKHDDRTFTPRIGKPVEINALWLNALEVTMRLAGTLENDAARRFCAARLEQAGASFARFWNPNLRCLYDVIDVDGGTAADASIRPNQLFAVSLPYSVLPMDQMRTVVDTCGRELLTSYGLRSLSPGDPKYLGHYTGNPGERDSAYHQGTVWAWLLGPFARAHYRVYGRAALAMSFLAPIAQHLDDACLGSVSEIFDGDAPHTAKGCFAQAWSVAEILHSWLHIERAAHTQPAARK